jgi:hypothetical protein
MKFSLETRKEIWNDETSDKLTVGPDADGLGCIEIKELDANGKTLSRITMPPEQAKLVAQAINELLCPKE